MNRILTFVIVLGACFGSRALPAATFGKVVAIGGQASDIALDEGRNQLYIANFTANRIDVMSLADAAIHSSINVPPQPSSLSLSADGRFLAITHFGNWAPPAPATNAVTVVDLQNGNARQTYALSSAPLGVAFGLDGRALVVTSTDYLLLDPVTGSIDEVDSISGVVAKTLPVPPANFPPQISAASLAVSGDGMTIFGVGGSDSTFTFRYDVAGKTIQPGQVVLASGLFGPRVVSVNQDGSRVMAGWAMLNSTGRFMHLLRSSNQFNVGSSVFDSARNLLYAQIPETAGEQPVLKIMDADNLAVLDRVYLPENLAGKSVLSSDGSIMYSVSDSGVLILPVGYLNRFPRLALSTPDLLFVNNFCQPGATSKTLTVTDPGGGATPFTIAADSSAVSVSPASGTTPAQITISVDPSALAGTTGTAVVNLQFNSRTAVNVPPAARVLINTREPDVRGTVVNVPGILSDVLADPARSRFYITRKNTNQLLVFDSGNFTQIAALKTGNEPVGMAITTDARYLLVANRMSQLVNVYDLDTLSEQAPIYIPGHTANSVAASTRAILATTIDYQSKGRVMSLSLTGRTSVELPNLGVFANNISPDAVAAASPNGAAILIAGADGNTLLYDATADSFTASRNDTTTLSGGYGASNFGFYGVGNSVLNASLVPVMHLDTAGASSGFAFVDQTGLRTTAPAASSTSSGNSVTAPLAGGPGVIQRIDVSATAPTVQRATRLAEAPLSGSAWSAFSRTIAPLADRSAIVNLTTSGFTVLPWQYDVAIAPPHIETVVNAADGTAGIAPGALVSLYGEQLSPVNMASSELPLPTALANSCLSVNGLPVPMLFVSPAQVNAQMPFRASGNITLALHTPGGVSDNYYATIVPVAPSVFLVPVPGEESTVTPAVVRAANNRLSTVSNPVHYGDVLTIYLTGLGATSPAVPSGAPAPANPLAVTLTQPQLTLGGVALPVMYAGLAPGAVGLYQINVKIPGDVPEGMSIPLTITQGSASTTVSMRVIH